MKFNFDSKTMEGKMAKISPVIFTSLCFFSSLGIPSTKQIRVTCEAEPCIVSLNDEVDMAECSFSWMYLSTPSSTRISFTFHLRLTLGNEGSVEQLKISFAPRSIWSGPSICSLVGLSKQNFLLSELLRVFLTFNHHTCRCFLQCRCLTNTFNVEGFVHL